MELVVKSTQNWKSEGGRGPSSLSVTGALFGLSLAILAPSLSTSVANISLPTLAQAFGAPFQYVQWVLLAYLLAITTLIVSAGRLGDRVGRRRLLLVGTLIFTAASAACGLAPSLLVLIIARAVQGVGAAIMMALSMAFVGQIVPKERTGRAMGLLGTMSAVGTALGPSLGGFLIAALGWNSIFLINVPLGIIAFAFVRRFLPRDISSDRKDGRFDVLGTFLLAIALASYALSMTIGRGHFGGLNMALLSAAVVFVCFFVLAEKKAEAPLIRLSVFNDVELTGSLVVSAVVSTVMMATLVVGPFYLSRALGLNPTGVGLVMSVGPLVVALSGVPAGRLADHLGAQRVTIAGLLLISAGALGLSLSPPALGIWGYLAPVIVITSGYSLFQTANNTAVMSGVHADRRGVISGMLNLSRNLGLITGASAMGALFAAASGAGDIAAASHGAVGTGMSITFGVAWGLAIVAFVISISSQAMASRKTQLDVA